MEDVTEHRQDASGESKPPGLTFDASVAHPARIYNYWLGGKDNFAADRAAAQEVLDVMPVIAQVARSNRLFLSTAVHYLVAQAGIRQFLDIGTGLPTENNTHEVAQKVAPESRVVYVDNDPIVLSHARALLTSDSRFMAAAPSGSYLAISHASSDLRTETQTAGRSYNAHSATPITFRSRQEVTRFFSGLELVPPGVSPLGQWSLRPTGTGSAQLPTYAALARKP